MALVYGARIAISQTMPSEIAQRWDERYSSEERFSFEQPRPFLCQQAKYLPTHGLALDVAMGLGGNAGFLLTHGLRVIGVDISMIALRKAKTRLPGLMAVLADANNFYIPPSYFDVIINFYFLERSLLAEYSLALKPGGVMVVETLTVAMKDIRPDIDAQNLLQPGELSSSFPDLDILIYQEGWQEGRESHPRSVASMLARRPL